MHTTARKIRSDVEQIAATTWQQSPVIMKISAFLLHSSPGKGILRFAECKDGAEIYAPWVERDEISGILGSEEKKGGSHGSDPNRKVYCS